MKDYFLKTSIRGVLQYTPPKIPVLVFIALLLSSLLTDCNLISNRSTASVSDTMAYNTTSPAIVGHVLPNDWHIDPAGQEIRVGNLPTNGALSPDGRYLAVVNTGCSTKTQEISIVDLADEKLVSTFQVKSLFIGVVFGMHGHHLYVSGSNENVVYRFAFQKGKLAMENKIPVPGYPAGIELLPDNRLAVAENLNDMVALIDLKTLKLIKQQHVGRYPYELVLSPDKTKLFVTNWGSGSVSVIDTVSFDAKDTITVGALPEALLSSGHRQRLYVTCTNGDTVKVIDMHKDRVVQTFDLHFQDLPSGTAPTGLALDDKAHRLYVSLAGINADIVLNSDSGRILGYIPAGWYPTGVYYDAAYNRIITLNAKGLGTGPNPDGPKPGTNALNQSQYIYGIIQGTVSIVRVPDDHALRAMTAEVIDNSLVTVSRHIPQDTSPIPYHSGEKSPIRHVFFIVKENRTYDQVLGDLPGANGDSHLVIFGRVVTPNTHRLSESFVTMDNYYADSEVSVQGHAWTDGAYSTDYVEKNTPLFYSGRYPHYDGGVVPITYPPNGYIWKTLEQNHISFRIYGENYYLHSGLYYTLERVLDPGDPLIASYYRYLRTTDGRDPTGIAGSFFNRFQHDATLDERMLDRKLLHNISFRTDISTILTGSDALAVAMRHNAELRHAVAGYLSHYQFDYRDWDLKYSDVDRAAAFIRELNHQIKVHRVPAFNYLWLPNDHTAGMKPGFLPPQVLVAQNDEALGMIVSFISHTPIWKDSVIFVTEDDAQDGSDHVDAHRTVGLVVGPYVKRRYICHTHYDQMSMLKTMELILGIKSMSLFDASALPLYDVFTNHPDFTPYNAVNPVLAGQIALHNVNHLRTLSEKLDFSRPDIGSQDDVLNVILWEAIRGTKYPTLKNFN